MIDSLKNLTTIIMAGGKGERLFPLTRDKAKPVDHLRQPLPHHRLHPVQLPQFGYPPHLRPLPVRQFFPGPAPAPGLGHHAPRPGRVHLLHAAPADHGEPLVPGHRRLHLPEPQPPGGRAPQARLDPLRRSRLQDELPGDAGFSPAPGGRSHRGRGHGAPGRGQLLRHPQGERRRRGREFPGKAQRSPGPAR